MLSLQDPHCVLLSLQDPHCVLLSLQDELWRLREKLSTINEELARERARARLWETMFVADRVSAEEAAKLPAGKAYSNSFGLYTAAIF